MTPEEAEKLLDLRGTVNPADFPLLPFEEAVKALKRRGQNLVPSGHWTEVWQSAHHTAFTVARSAGYDILGDVHAAVLKSREQGITLEQFKKELTPLLQAKGWWGRTEDGVQLGSPRRLRTIYDVNMRTSAAQGNWERQQRLKDERPYLRYTALLDGKTRPLHKSWHGIVLHIDDPWWKTHYPPNGWKCRCGAEELSQDDLDRFGYKLTDRAPDDGTESWVHPLTGEIRQVPSGIDAGWDYNPGNVDAAAHAAKTAMDKLANLPPSLGAKAVTDMAFTFPQVERELAGWIEGIAAEATAGTFQPKGQRRVVGAFSDAILDFMQGRGISPASAAISVGDADILHGLRTAKVKPLPIETWKRLPTLLAEPEAIYWDLREPGLVYVVNSGSGKFVVLVDYVTKVERKKTQVNTVRTGRTITGLAEFNDPAAYQRVDKK